MEKEINDHFKINRSTLLLDDPRWSDQLRYPNTKDNLQQNWNTIISIDWGGFVVAVIGCLFFFFFNSNQNETMADFAQLVSSSSEF